MQAAGSRMNAFTDRVSTMSKDIYKKSLGMQNYVTYSIDSMCTESTLGRYDFS